MKVIDLLNKIANGELEDETMISCNGFFHNIIYKNENLYWVHKNEIVETKYIIEAMKNDYEFKIYNEVEIIEEEKENEFTGLKMFSDGKCFCSIDTSEKIKCKDDVKIEEKKIPEKLKCKYTSQIGKIELAKTINEIIDYLEENK